MSAPEGQHISGGSPLDEAPMRRLSKKPPAVTVVRVPIPGQGDPWYAFEKFHHAVYDLATNRSSIRPRLWVASRDFIAVSPRDFPDHVRPAYEQLRKDMTRLEPNSAHQ